MTKTKLFVKYSPSLHQRPCLQQDKEENFGQAYVLYSTLLYSTLLYLSIFYIDYVELRNLNPIEKAAKLYIHIITFCMKSNLWQYFKNKVWKSFRGHSELNQGPIGLQPIALPLSYIPSWKLNYYWIKQSKRIRIPKFWVQILN